MLCQSELKEMSSVSVEIVEVNNQGRVPANTFRVYAVMPSPKYSVGVIFGNNQHVLGSRPQERFVILGRVPLPLSEV